MTSKKIREIIEKGESNQVEFKATVPDDLILARILSAFANTKGGFLIIGINDEKEILGLSKYDINEGIKKISKVLDKLLDPTAVVPIHSLEYENKNILIVEVPQNTKGNLPVILPDGKMYIRQNAATRAATASIMARNLSHNISSHVLSNFSDYLESRKEHIKNLENQELRIFVAMSFREEQEPALVDYYKAMERATKGLKLPIEITRMDLIEGYFEISQQIMDEIDKSDLVIADFTLSPQNVYFELGYARGRNKRIIQTCRKGTKIEFDTRNWKTIIYRNATELEVKIQPAIKVAFEEIMKIKKASMQQRL